jgi:DNA-binding GntR family transcriptional regulator
LPADAIADLKLERESTPQRVATALRELILSGELEAGTFLREAVLAEQLEVSRNTVREAMQTLIADGLITRSAHRGAQVRRATAGDVRDLYRIRRLLECAAIREVTPSTDLEPLDRRIEAFRTALEGASAAELIEAELAFHEALVGLLESERLLTLFRDVAGEIRLCLALTDERSSLEQLLVEHEEILNGLRAGDLQTTEATLRAHLGRAEELLLRGLSQESE